MLNYSPVELDYIKLYNESRKIDPSTCNKEIRVAVLAEGAVQQFSVILRSLFYKNKIHAVIYEAPFDGVEGEVLNPASELYAFKPDCVIILPATQKWVSTYFSSDDKHRAADEVVSKLSMIWQTLTERTGAVLLQGNYVLPCETLFGNYDARVSSSLYALTTRLNRSIVEAAASAPGVHLGDVDRLAGLHGRKNWFDARLWVFGKSPCAPEFLPHLAQTFVDVYLTVKGRVIKCIVLDLDNTTWGGIIGDDGLEGIALGHLGEGEAFTEFQSYVLELKKRGIILAVCSKNDYENAVQPFREHPEMVLKEKDIAVFIANWNNKADNITQIKEALNIGYDSIVFFDDSPYERNLVREFLPEVVVPDLPEDPAEYVKAISELNLFETISFTEEDKDRADMYRTEFQRQDLQKSFTNIGEYLASLEMKITVERFNDFNLPRIAQLIQRSNQFNLRTIRYTQADCEAFMKDAAVMPLYIKLKDKFGDYGLISVVILKPAPGGSIFIDEWIMSCRVLSRGVEQFVMNYVFEYAAAHSYALVRGEYVPTSKNGMVRDFYQKFGYEPDGPESDGTTRWARQVDAYQPENVFIEQVRESADG